MLGKETCFQGQLITIVNSSFSLYLLMCGENIELPKWHRRTRPRKCYIPDQIGVKISWSIGGSIRRHTLRYCIAQDEIYLYDYNLETPISIFSSTQKLFQFEQFDDISPRNRNSILLRNILISQSIKPNRTRFKILIRIIN